LVTKHHHENEEDSGGRRVTTVCWIGGGQDGEKWCVSGGGVIPGGRRITWCKVIIRSASTIKRKF